LKIKDNTKTMIAARRLAEYTYIELKLNEITSHT
jgi:hypothetical protein